MKPISVVTGCVLALSIGAMANAGNVTASDPQSVMGFFFDQGIPAQLTTDNVGDPKIDYRHDGEAYTLFFYGCTRNVACTSLNFITGHQVNNSISLEMVNTWNADNRYGAAYLNEDMDTRLTFDLHTGADGIETDLMLANYERWIGMVDDFETYIDW